LTLSGGTANGVAYLNGSKVLTTGSALVFDGTNLAIGNANPTERLEVVNSSGAATAKVWSATNTTPIASIELQRGTNATWGADGYGDYRIRNDAGNLLFQYGDSGTTTTRATIDSSGNLGLGVTPSAWNSENKVLEFAYAGTIAGNTTLDLYCNAYVNSGGTNKYIGSYAYASKYTQYNGAHKWFNTTSTQGAGNTLTWNQAMTLDASGNLGIGTTSTSAEFSGYTALKVSGGSGATVSLSSGTTVRGQIASDGAHTYISQFGSGGIIFGVQSGAFSGGTATERARIYPNGTFGVTAATATALTLTNTAINGGSTSGTTGVYFGDAGSGCVFLERSKTGVNVTQLRLYTEHGYNSQALWAYGYNTAAYQGNNSTTWSTTSDERVKTNIRPISNALDKICALNAVHFEYKNALGKTKTSFIAQQFEQVLPGHVHEVPAPDDLKQHVGEDGMMKALDPDLIPYLVKAIQEQQAIIESLTQRITALETP
jgi:hypothetical protein